MDLVFEEEGGDKLAALAINARISRMLAATMAPRKSTGEHAAQRAAAFVKGGACDQIRASVKSDKEPAIVDLVERVGKVRASKGA